MWPSRLETSAAMPGANWSAPIAIFRPSIARAVDKAITPLAKQSHASAGASLTRARVVASCSQRAN
jgi:hypothetical protein